MSKKRKVIEEVKIPWYQKVKKSTWIMTAIINEVFIIVSVLLSIKRFGWRQMIDPESDFQKK